MGQILGYENCPRCGRGPHPELLLQRCGGVCRLCVGVTLGKVRHIELRNGVEVLRIGARHRNRASKGDRHASHLSNKARINALRRLRRLFPAVYEALLMDERERLGLEAASLSPSVPNLDLSKLEAALEVAEQLHEALNAYPSAP